MLGHLEKVSDDKAARHCMENFYSKTLDSFSSTRNDRLWLKINLRFARLYLEAKDYQSLLLKLRELYEACKTEPGEDPDSSKGTYLLESYALEIQMYAEQNNIKRLKVLYEKAIKVRSAVPHPKIMGIIRECGGKMHMREENWDQAQQAFFESFRNYDEAGSVQRIQVLKYLVLTTMLMKSEINPFDSQETKPYRDDPRIAGMNALVDAYQRGEVTQYENILRQYRDEIFGDEFISEYIQEVTRNVRMKALAKLVAPYDSFTVEFVAKQLKVPEVEALDLLSFLILDGGLPAKIDQAKGQVHLVGNPDQARVDALSRWSAAVGSLCAVVTKESDGIMSKKGPMPPLAGSRLIEQYAFDMLSLSSSKKGGDEGEVGGDDDQGGDRGDGQIHRLDSPFKGLNGRKRLRDAQSRLHPVSQGDESLGYGTKDLRGMETLFGSP